MKATEEQARPRLGRGLAALIADSANQMPEGGVGVGRTVPTDQIRPNPRNPRRAFDAADIEDLAQSIRSKGLIQPIVVRPAPTQAGQFEIIAGERRWRAARLAGLQTIPIVEVAASDGDALALAIIENVQRADLNPMEEARGYEQLATEFGYSPADLAKIVGKSRSHVANTLRLLKLPPSVEALVVDGSLSAGHARALLSVDEPETLAPRIVSQGLTVRDVEKLARSEPRAARSLSRKTREEVLPPALHPDAVKLANRLSDSLGFRVSLEPRPDGGELRIRYATLEDLDMLCRRLIR